MNYVQDLSVLSLFLVNDQNIRSIYERLMNNSMQEWQISEKEIAHYLDSNKNIKLVEKYEGSNYNFLNRLKKSRQIANNIDKLFPVKPPIIVHSNFLEIDSVKYYFLDYNGFDINDKKNLIQYLGLSYKLSKSNLLNSWVKSWVEVLYNSLNNSHKELADQLFENLGLDLELNWKDFNLKKVTKKLGFNWSEISDKQIFTASDFYNSVYKNRLKLCHNSENIKNTLSEITKQIDNYLFSNLNLSITIDKNLILSNGYDILPKELDFEILSIKNKRLILNLSLDNSELNFEIKYKWKNDKFLSFPEYQIFIRDI